LNHDADFTRPIDIYSPGPYRGYSAIHLAVRLGAVDIVNLLLDRCVSVDQPTEEWGPYVGADFQNFRGPLHLAAMYDQDEIVKLLLRRGAQIDKGDGWGLSALAYAEFPWHTENQVVMFDIVAAAKFIDSNEPWQSRSTTAAILRAAGATLNYSRIEHLRDMFCSRNAANTPSTIM
jgi:hypothetical protein